MDLGRSKDNTGGVLVFEGHLPIYVPVGSENPGWVITPYPAQYNELLHLGLNTARELGDYGLEVLYLEELVLKSDNPQIYLADLTKLQKNVVGDKSGHLRVCLAKYLLVTEQEGQKDLSNQLGEIDREETSAGRNSDPTLKWFQGKIQRALCSSLSFSKQQQDMFSWMEKSAFNQLPRDFSNRYQLLHSASRNDSYYWRESSIAEYTTDDRVPRPYMSGNPSSPNLRPGSSFFPDGENSMRNSSFVSPFMPPPRNMGSHHEGSMTRKYSPRRETRTVLRENVPAELQVTKEESGQIDKDQQLAKEAKERDRSSLAQGEDRDNSQISRVDNPE
ncbi:hypothetical protein DSL72_008899 [Monilinia vaccinii-corymbosi]|uniref:Uncharacterized protein n=1 Tax=Monilinia vaccinii-corymbosi TaxID=61207 RepID=A0A8A3PRL6_9HELO|nr:hypothetical protein DSL72_008899 [Monilinia vaccinii-corymbosi]